MCRPFVLNPKLRCSEDLAVMVSEVSSKHSCALYVSSAVVDVSHSTIAIRRHIKTTDSIAVHFTSTKGDRDPCGNSLLLNILDADSTFAPPVLLQASAASSTRLS